MDDLSTSQELFKYYDERAPEYEAFYHGEFPAAVPNPEMYRQDTVSISKLLPVCINGNFLDIACGTGFWLPVYEKNCTRITLIDQSESALAECTKKIKSLGIGSKTEIIRDDLFSCSFKAGYDSVLAGFLLSHFNDKELDKFLSLLKSLLKNSGRFIIIDSIWSEEIASIRHTKAGIIQRTLFDGRQFRIYKRCFEKQDLMDIALKYCFKLEIIYWGKVFFLANGKFN